MRSTFTLLAALAALAASAFAALTYQSCSYSCPLYALGSPLVLGVIVLNTLECTYVPDVCTYSASDGTGVIGVGVCPITALAVCGPGSSTSPPSTTLSTTSSTSSFTGIMSSASTPTSTTSASATTTTTSSSTPSSSSTTLLSSTMTSSTSSAPSSSTVSIVSTSTVTLTSTTTTTSSISTSHSSSTTSSSSATSSSTVTRSSTSPSPTSAPSSTTLTTSITSTSSSSITSSTTTNSPSSITSSSSATSSSVTTTSTASSFTSKSSSTTTTPPAPTGTLPAGWSTAYACAVDTPSRVFASSEYYQLEGTNTPAACIALCGNRGFSLAGVEYGYECFCASSYVNGPPAAANVSDCNVPCSGDASQTCGGGYRLQIYTNPDALAEAAALPAGWAQTYACAVDTPNRVFTDTVNATLADNTPVHCIQHCSAQGYTMAGVENSAECYCGTSYLNNTAPASSTADQCNEECKGAPGLMCGGDYAIQLYATN